jgi:hypothetical protein
MIFREPLGILQEVEIPKNNMIPGCNSSKKSHFQNYKAATIYH